MKFFRKHIVLTLAMLITLSAAGINISLHRCCGKIKSVSIFGDAGECKMEQAAKKIGCKSGQHSSYSGENCCNDQQIYVKASDKAVNINHKVDNQSKDESFDVLLVYNFFANWFSSSEEEEEEQNRPAPGLYIVEALVVMLQQFRL